MEKTTGEQQILQIRKLLQDKCFKEAYSRFDTVDTHSMNEADRVYISLLKIEISLYLGIYNIENDISRAIEYYRESHHNLEFAQAKYFHGWLLTAKGDYFQAKEVLQEAYTGFIRCGSLKWQGRSLNRMAFISIQVGDCSAAVNQLQKCIALYEKLKDEASVVVSMNLASLLYSVGQLSESLKLYEIVEERLIKQISKMNRTLFYCNFAIPNCLKGDIKSARNIIYRAVSYLTCHSREEAIYYENLGWIELIAGDYRAAEEALQKGLEISLEIAPESALVSQIKRRLADACIGLGKSDLAGKYADEALIVAEKINERVEIAACYRVYAQLECRIEGKDAAKDWFKKSIDLFSLIGSRYELAVTRYLAAISGVYLNGERQALLYLAREYFDSENVEHYVAKINSEIKKVRTIYAARPAVDNGQPPEIVTINPILKRQIELAEHIAPSQMSVLLTGPTGTGKDLFARFIHHYSGRTGKFVSVNTAAIPQNMIEAELFGYRKGAYTGADRTTTGWIEEAHLGTIYLNEIADSSAEFQAKLLDVIERRRICRLGDRVEREVDFRVIAATNHDIEQLIQDDKFRRDLFHRLGEISINLPPLAARREDISVLLKYFLGISGISIKAKGEKETLDRLAGVLESHDWPGNVREFRAAMERLILLSNGDIGRMSALAKRTLISDRDRLHSLLRKTNWNRSRVAKLLGITEGTVRHRIKKYNLTPENEF